MADTQIDDEAPPNQFDLARKRAAQQNNAAVQGQQDALKRRFAANGALNSGAAIKQDQLASEAGQANLANVNEGINAQQATENQRVKEIQQGRDFQTSERLGSQDYGAQQAALGRQFQTGERLGGQDFGAAQAELQRKFQTGERLSSEDFANLQRIGGQDFAAGQNNLNRQVQTQQFLMDIQQKNKAMDMQQDQFDKQMSAANRQYMEDHDTNEFNKQMAQAAANQNNGGLFGSIFGIGAGNSYLGKSANNANSNYLSYATLGTSKVLGV